MMILILFIPSGSTRHKWQDKEREQPGEALQPCLQRKPPAQEGQTVKDPLCSKRHCILIFTLFLPTRHPVHTTWIQPCTSPGKLSNCRATGKWQHRHISVEGRCSFCLSFPCSPSPSIFSPSFPLIWSSYCCCYCQYHMLNAVSLRSLKRQSSYLPTRDCSSPKQIIFQVIKDLRSPEYFRLIRSTDYMHFKTYTAYLERKHRSLFTFGEFADSITEAQEQVSPPAQMNWEWKAAPAMPPCHQEGTVPGSLSWAGWITADPNISPVMTRHRKPGLRPTPGDKPTAQEQNGHRHGFLHVQQGQSLAAPKMDVLGQLEVAVKPLWQQIWEERKLKVVAQL